MSLDVETRIRDITEKYRTLSMYGIEVSWIAKAFFIQLVIIKTKTKTKIVAEQEHNVFDSHEKMEVSLCNDEFCVQHVKN